MRTGSVGARAACPGPHSWCWFCYANVKGRSNFKGHRGYRRPSMQLKEAFQMGKLSRSSTEVNGESGYAAVDPVFLQGLPTLYEYLAGSQWEDGKSRETSTLLIFCEDGLWKCCLNDRATQRTAWHSAASFQALLSELEAGLCTQQLGWRKRQKGR